MAYKMLLFLLILQRIRLESRTSFGIGVPPSAKNFAFSLPFFRSVNSLNDSTLWTQFSVDLLPSHSAPDHKW